VPSVLATSRFLVTLATLACGSDPTVPPPPEGATGILVLRFVHTVGTEPLTLSDASYTAPSGSSYAVDSLRYVLTDLALAGGGARARDTAFEALIDVRDPTSLEASLSVPPARYDGLSLRIGLPDARNRVLSEAERPARRWEKIAWPDSLGGGYHFLLAHGRLGAAADPESAFVVALGRQVLRGHPVYGDTTLHRDAMRPVETAPFVVAEDETTAITIRMDLEEWLTRPNFIDLRDFTADTRADVALADDLVENGRDVFAGEGVPTPNVIDVPADFPTIQEAIDASAEGDTVLVADGTYSGPGNHDIDFSSSTSPFPHNIVVKSRRGPAFTIIDVQGSPSDPRRGVIFRSSEDTTSVLDGFTIRNGWMSSFRESTERHDLSGGGIIVRFANATPIIRNCIIERCYSEFSGGGLEAEVGAAPIIEDCVFAGNRSANFGGALSFEFGANATLRRCVITGNEAGTGGGGVSIRAPTRFESCTISGNRAGAVGGGLGVGTGGGLEVRHPGTANLEQSIVWENCAPDSGEEVYVEPKGSAGITFACSVVDTAGAPIHAATFEDCVFRDPSFCDAIVCDDAPTTAGDVRVTVVSPCLPESNPCGVLIGARGAGCATTKRGVIPWE